MTIKLLLVFAAGLLFIGWLIETPPGVLGKADAIGYSVCHRIEVRSFLLGERQLPLCARCTGMYLGALLGMVYLLPFGRRAGMPALKVSIVLGGFVLLFAFDGGNSYLHLFPGAPGLYAPQNWLRLLTGTGMGLGLAAVLVPVIHQTLWQQYDARRALQGWRQFLPLMGLAGLVDLMVLSGNPLLLFPLGLFSAAEVVVILTLVYALVWVLITKKDNCFHHYRQLWVLLVAGFMTAMIQIAMIDAGRFWLTRTWGGFFS